jgi:hypothetical protein
MTNPIKIKKSSTAKIQVAEKQTNTSLVEPGTTSDVGIQTMENTNVLTDISTSINKTTSMYEETKTLKVNQEKASSTIKENHVTRTPYRHKKHKSRCINKSEHQYHSGQKQLTYLPKNIDTSIIKSHNKFWESYKHNVPQIIKLGWSNHLIVRNFFLTLIGSHCLISSTTTTPRTKNDANTLQAKEKRHQAPP